MAWNRFCRVVVLDLALAESSLWPRDDLEVWCRRVVVEKSVGMLRRALGRTWVE